MNLFTAKMGWEIPASSCICGERENPQRISNYLAGDVISGGKENLMPCPAVFRGFVFLISDVTWCFGRGNSNDCSLRNFRDKKIPRARQK